MKIKKIVIANRGEIALRVMRTAKEMGISTVAVFSEADRLAPHVRYADEAYCIGAAPSDQSYLKGEKIIQVALNCGADAIHPGYGFLSENATFAQAVANAGLIFIGPSAHSIELMGSKLGAKEAVKKYGVPLVPGSEGAVTDVNEAVNYANQIGYPVLIKASAGGGGKGMRVVQNAEEMEEQMQRAMSEAASAFGDSAVFVEKYILNPKHIEIQILGDQHGNVVYLFERECSIQRRHQKVIEEAPSAILTPQVRKAMGEAAVKVAKACNYYNAGTVEFVVDKNLNFYFLEMNTRLQVEHPVTEQITGIDLVRQQILIAEGASLPFTQDDLQIKGHAIEIRVYAEDPANNFLPDIGKLTTYRRPQGNGIRVDDGIEEKMEIPIFYDPMIAKLVATGNTRQEAIQKMLRAIDEYKITGVETTLPFCRFVLQHESFISGHFDTGFVDKYFKPELLQTTPDTTTQELAAIVAAMVLQQNKSNTTEPTSSAATQTSNWKKNRVQ
jgi:acetyl-CoA carboxylase biotin carboxylase subunit